MGFLPSFTPDIFCWKRWMCERLARTKFNSKENSFLGFVWNYMSAAVVLLSKRCKKGTCASRVPPISRLANQLFGCDRVFISLCNWRQRWWWWFYWQLLYGAILRSRANSLCISSSLFLLVYSRSFWCFHNPPNLFWLLNFFNAELTPKRYWRGPKSQEVGK